MKTKEIRNLVISAMFIALGILLPFLTGQIPEIGNMLLPMHIPVFLAGLFCGYGYGAAVGFILPLLRSLIFTKPIMYPSAVAMAFELSVYGFVAGFLYMRQRKKSLGTLYFSIISAMLLGRIVWGVIMAILMGIGDKPFGVGMFFAEAFTNAVPGIVIQLILIPILMVAAKKTTVKKEVKKPLFDAERIVMAVEKLLSENERIIIAIDGPSGAGKSTLAGELEKRLAAQVLHTDDFFLPIERKTKERLSLPGENIDHERFLCEVLLPIYNGTEPTYRKFLCKTQTLDAPTVLKQSRVYIVEGVYSCHESLAPYYDLKIFIEVSKKTQRERILFRSGEAQLMRYESEWIPLENTYFEAFKIKNSADIIIQS